MSWNSNIFKRIKSESYFPPLKLIRSGGKYLPYEDSFGLAAQTEIDKNIFIGEYAADIISPEYLQCCTRLDTVMDLGVVDNQKLTITPLISMGYVCFINCAVNDEERNCNSLKLEINGECKIIIYTTKKIQPGEEIMYNYG